MKTNWIGGWPAVLLMALPTLAMAQTAQGRFEASGAPVPMQVLPISAPDEHRTAPALRDVLRLPYEESTELGSKPYRLSPEARQRLREQVRGHAGGVATKGKP